MSASPDPRIEHASQSDEKIISSGIPTLNGGARFLPTILTVVFCFLLCFAGVYLDRHAGDFSAAVYNEDARALGASDASKPKTVDMVAFGKKQYLSQCVTCHQPNGLGTPGTYPPLAGSEWATGSEERAIRIVLHGLTGPITVSGTTYPGTVQMPSFGKVPNSGYNWRDDQIAAALTYVRQEWGNKAPAVTPEKVTEIRSKEIRATPWTAPELLAIK